MNSTSPGTTANSYGPLQRKACPMSHHPEQLAYRNTRRMKAIALSKPPERGRVAETLRMMEVPVPRPRRGEVIIKLAASAMHIDEIYAAQGTMLGRFLGRSKARRGSVLIMGSSVSGTIVETGGKTHPFYVGDEVIVIPDKYGEVGAWAEYKCVSAQSLKHKNARLTHVEAAAVTMAACVALQAVTMGKPESEQRCLVVGASGGIGIMVLQYLKSYGCKVTAVCNASSSDLVRQHGADAVCDYTTDSIATFANWNCWTYDSVYDCVGGRDIEADAFKVLKSNGRFVTVVGPEKHPGERALSLFRFLHAVGHVIWQSLRTRFGGPRYVFAVRQPALLIHRAMQRLLDHDIRMPAQEIPFDAESIKAATRVLIRHQAKGRFVINFDLLTQDQRPLIDPSICPPQNRLAAKAAGWCAQT